MPQANLSPGYSHAARSNLKVIDLMAKFNPILSAGFPKPGRARAALAGGNAAGPEVGCGSVGPFARPQGSR